MQILRMDFQSQSAPPIVPVMQSDSQSRFWGMALYNGGIPYEAPTGAVYTVQYRGPGANNIGWYDTVHVGTETRAAVTVDRTSKHIVTLELAPQALQRAGDVHVNLCVMTDSGYSLRTFDIIARVNTAAYPDEVAVSSYFYLSKIQSASWLSYLTGCQNAQSSAAASASQAAKSAAQASSVAKNVLNSLAIGSVTSGESAAASIENGKLDLVLPRGEKGDKGDAGANGSQGLDGYSTNLILGSVTSAINSSASIEHLSTDESARERTYALSLVLPDGEKGDDGQDGYSVSLGIGSVTSGATASASIVCTNIDTQTRERSYELNLVLPEGSSELVPIEPTLTIGSVTSGDTAMANITPDGKLNLVLPRGEKGESAPQPATQEFGLAWIYWTNDLLREDIESDAARYAKHDLIVMQRLDLNKLADSKPKLTTDSVAILKQAKKLNPKLRYFEYIPSESGRLDFTYNGDHAHLNADGSWEGSTAALSGCSRIYTYAQLCDWLDYYKSEGVDGIFWDDWGYDFAKEDICAQMGLDADEEQLTDLNKALDRKWRMLIMACHERGLAVITNGRRPFEVGKWYQFLYDSDVIAMESCLISANGYTWQPGQTELYDYYANWRVPGNCMAKIWSLDYFPPDAEDISQEVLTYLCTMAMTTGANYVSMGVNRCIEMPPVLEPFLEGTSKKIVQIDSDTYQLTVGAHTLESHRWKSLSSSTVSANTVDRNYYIYDGKPFRNGFTVAPVVETLYDDRITAVENIVESSTVDTRKNASSFWRMAIDDWQGSLSFMDYNNLLAGKLQLMPIADVNIEQVVNLDGTVDLVFTYSGNFTEGNPFIQVITANNDESLNLTGQELEFGFADVLFEMEDGSWTLPNGTAWYGNLWLSPSFRPYITYTVNGEEKTVEWIKGTGSELGSPAGHWERTKAGTITALNLCFWTRAPEGKTITGKITFKNAYLIDVGEHSDEVLNTWYTNRFPASYTVVNQLGVTQTAAKQLNHTVYDITVTTDNAWGWVFYEFDSADVMALRGHTLELGCMSMAFSDGATGRNDTSWKNYAFGVGINTEDAPTTVRLYTDMKEKSTVWDTKMPCVTFTVPNTASTLILGYRSYGFDTSVTLTIKGAYLYDLEEAVDIRGKSSTNASLRLCRITEEKETANPSDLRNALYVTEKGRMYSTDLSGNKIPIAGAVYAGAVEAGYTGTPDEFGAALAALLTSKTT